MHSKLKHTPGPWKVMPGSLNFSKLLVRAPQSDKAIADCDYQQGEEGAANAQLVAAAPTLLNTLKEIDLRATQTRLASQIVKKPKRIEFLLTELERLQAVAVAAIAAASEG